MPDLPSEPSVVFSVDRARFALPLAAVETVVRAAQMAPINEAREFVAGAVNVHGALLPVFDLRARCGWPVRAMGSGDYFVIARAGGSRVALWVDEVFELASLDRTEPPGGSEWTEPPGNDSGARKWGGGLIFIEDLERFLFGERDRRPNCPALLES